MSLACLELFNTLFDYTTRRRFSCSIYTLYCTVSSTECGLCVLTYGYMQHKCSTEMKDFNMSALLCQNSQPFVVALAAFRGIQHRFPQPHCSPLENLPILFAGSNIFNFKSQVHKYNCLFSFASDHCHSSPSPCHKV